MKSFPIRIALAAAALVLTAGCQGEGGANASNVASASALLPVTISGGWGSHKFDVEVARTEEQQRQGLMYRTDLGKDGGMLFYPYPPEGPPQEASFWMKNTPTSLDTIFIRADGTIARIAENTVPQSTDPVTSGEPVAAVLELVGGRSAELGISEGDKVNWPGRK